MPVIKVATPSLPGGSSCEPTLNCTENAIVGSPATGISTVMINYYNDVGVFTFVELGTTVAVRNNNDSFTSEGKSTFFTSLGTAGEHTTDYALSCGILK